MIDSSPLVLTASKTGGSQLGTSITLTATSNPHMTGNCGFYQGNPFTDPGAVSLGFAVFNGSGVAVLVTTGMHAGTKPLICFNNVPVFSNTLAMSVYTIALSVIPNNQVSGIYVAEGPFTYTATIFADTTPMVGSVAFSDINGPLGSASLTAGVGTVTAPLQTPITNVVTTATYSNFDNGTETVTVFTASPLQVDAATVAAINSSGFVGANVFTGILHVPFGTGWGEQLGTVPNVVSLHVQGYPGPTYGFGFNGTGSSDYGWSKVAAGPLGVYTASGGTIFPEPIHTVTITLA